MRRKPYVFSVTPVEVLEQLIKDPGKRPIDLISEPSHKCSQEVLNQLSELVEILIKDLCIDRFPNFAKIITTTAINEVYMPSITKLYKEIENEVLLQENYIWTEDISFIEVLENTNKSSVEIMRKLANNYYKAIVYIMQDVIPKKIMFYLVSKSGKELSQKLYEKVKEQKLDFLLSEYSEIEEKRKALEKSIMELSNAKKLIEGIM